MIQIYSAQQNSFSNSKHWIGKNSNLASSKQTFLKLSKTKFTLFLKSWDKDNLPIKLPILKINNFEIKRTSSIKFLGIDVDGNISWNDHIHILGNKLSKNIGLLYRAKPYLDKNAMTTLYFLQASRDKLWLYLKMITKKWLTLESSWKKMAF